MNLAPVRNIKKRGRGRPRAANGVTVYPVRREPDVGAISRAFIELGLALTRKAQKGVENAGL